VLTPYQISHRHICESLLKCGIIMFIVFENINGIF
jgi:hypothetical protein